MSESPTRGHAVTLDKERRLRFPLSALKQIEDDSSLGRILYLGLKHEDEDLTQEYVEEMVSLDMLDDLKAPLKAATGGLIDLDRLFGGGSAEATNPEKKGPVEQTSGS